MATTCSFGRNKDLRLTSLCVGSTLVIDEAKNINARDLKANEILARGNIHAKQSVIIDENLIVNKDATICGNLKLKGDITGLNGVYAGNVIILGNLIANLQNVNINSNTLVLDTLQVNHIATGDILANIATINDKLTLEPGTQVCGDLNLVNGNLTMESGKLTANSVCANTLQITGNAAIGGTTTLNMLNIGAMQFSNVTLGVGAVLITNYMELNINGTIYKIPIGI